MVARVVGVKVVSAVVRGQEALRVGRVGDSAVEVDDGVEGAARTNPLINGGADSGAVRGVIARVRAAFGRGQGRADHPDTARTRASDQGGIAGDQVGRGDQFTKTALAKTDVVDAFQHDDGAYARLTEDIRLKRETPLSP